MYMVAHRSRDAYSARWTLGLEPGRDIHAVTMQVRAIGNDIADVDADTKPDVLVGRLIAVVDRAPFVAS